MHTRSCMVTILLCMRSIVHLYSVTLNSQCQHLHCMLHSPLHTYVHIFMQLAPLACPAHPHDAKHLPTIYSKGYNNHCYACVLVYTCSGTLNSQSSRRYSVPYIPVLKAAPVSANCSILQSLVLRKIIDGKIEFSASWPGRQQCTHVHVPMHSPLSESQHSTSSRVKCSRIQCTPN